VPTRCPGEKAGSERGGIDWYPVQQRPKALFFLDSDLILLDERTGRYDLDLGLIEMNKALDI
jgi:hypothetical protein